VKLIEKELASIPPDWKVLLLEMEVDWADTRPIKVRRALRGFVIYSLLMLIRF